MSLNLDARQVAMLREMHIRQWSLPSKAAAHEQPNAAAPVAAQAPIQARIAAPALPAPPAPLRTEHPPTPRAPDTTYVRPEGVASMGWAALQQTVAGCQACKLCAGRTNTVFGAGPPPVESDSAPSVDWLIVGEAPGENEDLQGEPFVGQAGKLLDNMLRAVQLERGNKVFITNVLKCRPPGNRNPQPDEVAQCQPYLRRQIELLRPKIILAMGRFAVQTVLADSVPDAATAPLGRLRGRVYRYQDTPVVVTYHPAYLLRNLPDKAKAWADLCLALGVMRSG